MGMGRQLKSRIPTPTLRPLSRRRFPGGFQGTCRSWRRWNHLHQSPPPSRSRGTGRDRRQPTRRDGETTRYQTMDLTSRLVAIRPALGLLQHGQEEVRRERAARPDPPTITHVGDGTEPDCLEAWKTTLPHRLTAATRWITATVHRLRARGEASSNRARDHPGKTIRPAKIWRLQSRTNDRASSSDLRALAGLLLTAGRSRVGRSIA